MIDLHLHGLHIHSSLGVVEAHGEDRVNDTLCIMAEGLPDLTALLDIQRPCLNFDALEFRMAFCGVTFRKQTDIAEVLAAVLRAARFASRGTLDEVIQDEQSWKTQVQDVLLKLQERHLRVRLARLMGVQPGALDGFAPVFPRHTRSGLSAVLEGKLLGVDMQFTLEYEHLLLYAGTLDSGTLTSRKVTRLGDLTNAAQSTRASQVHQDQPQASQVSA